VRAPFQRRDPKTGRLLSDRWYFEFRRNGDRYCGSADTKAEAATAMKAKRTEIFKDEVYESTHGHRPFKPTPMTFGEYADYYFRTFCAKKRSAQRDKEILAFLKARWKGSLSAITTQMIVDLKAEREAARQPATVLQEVQVIKRLFKKAVALRKIQESPALTIERPEVHNERVKHLTPDEMKALMSALPDWLQPIVIFARFTGARQGEIFKLIWKDVDFKKGLITFRDTKNGSTGTVRMNATTRTLLESLPRPINPSLPVFTVDRQKARYRFDLAVAKAGLKVPCACLQDNDGTPSRSCSACSGKGIDRFKFHDLRHQAATELIARGATLNDVRDFLRHKTLAMTLRYSHLLDDRRANTAALLDLPAPGAAEEPQARGGDRESQ
jgi:integrase